MDDCNSDLLAFFSRRCALFLSEDLNNHCFVVGTTNGVLRSGSTTSNLHHAREALCLASRASHHTK